jgi:hypothetical protein
MSAQGGVVDGQQSLAELLGRHKRTGEFGEDVAAVEEQAQLEVVVGRTPSFEDRQGCPARQHGPRAARNRGYGEEWFPADDEHTIALVDATATRAGKTFKYRTAEIYHVRDGKIAERWAFSDDTAAITAFFA